MGNFVHLHVHSEYSLLDGAARIDRLVKKCVEYGEFILDQPDNFYILKI